MKKKVILVADDEQFIATAYGDALTDLEYEVLLAFDGEEVTNILKTRSPDLLLLDLLMPKKSGFVVLEELRLSKSKMPVIVLSNLSDEADRRKAFESGALDYIVKADLSLDEVLGRVGAVLNKYEH